MPYSLPLGPPSRRDWAARTSTLLSPRKPANSILISSYHDTWERPAPFIFRYYQKPERSEIAVGGGATTIRRSVPIRQPGGTFPGFAIQYPCDDMRLAFVAAPGLVLPGSGDRRKIIESPLTGPAPSRKIQLEVTTKEHSSPWVVSLPLPPFAQGLLFCAFPPTGTTVLFIRVGRALGSCDGGVPAVVTRWLP